MMKKLFFASLILGSQFYSCTPASDSSEDEISIRKGTIVIAADESLQPVVDAQVEAYRMHYPEAVFVKRYVPEQKAINLMLNDSVEVAIVTRELNKEELAVLEKRKVKYQPARMALDAVTLIVNKNYKDSTITLEEIRKIFTSEGKSSARLVFDNGSSSNLNFMLAKLKIDKFNENNVFAAKGNPDVFTSVEKNPDYIGVIGNNWISDLDDRKSVAFRDRIKILKVSEKDGRFYTPSFENIRDRKYPLERLVYLHTTQDRWGIAKGFIRFSCSQIGQLVVEKMGLLPFYVIPREVVLDRTPLSKKQKKE